MSLVEYQLAHVRRAVYTGGIDRNTARVGISVVVAFRTVCSNASSTPVAEAARSMSRH